MKIATIARRAENSPNMTTNDAAILECVAEELIMSGHDVFAIGENEDVPAYTDVVCHMSRSEDILGKLIDAENRGIKIVNSVDAVKNCSRIEFMRILDRSGIPQPQYRIIEKMEDLDLLPFPAWIKRGEGWSCHKDDVCYVTDREEAARAICMMQERGISRYVYTRHCEGDIVKFYGIGERYFTYGYPNADNTKFGLEKINGEAMHYPFDRNVMQETAMKAAKAVGLDIYGGDFIVNPEGNICMIDLNDFPSFSTARREAAKEIAKLITDSNRQDEKRG